MSLSPTHTEIMFAIGAGDQLVAVDDFSNYPAEALELPHELSGFEPNVEAIAAYEPDLVLIGGDFTGLGAQLDEIDIAWWDGPAALTLDDTYAQIEQLGAVTGHVAEAAELVAQMQTDIDQIVADTPVPDVPLTLYHELDSSFFSADSTTFIGELYGLLGLRNIADQAEGNSGGYPQLNAEFIVSANPDLIFLADTICCGETRRHGRRPTGLGRHRRGAERQRRRDERRPRVALGPARRRLSRRRVGGGQQRRPSRHDRNARAMRAGSPVRHSCSPWRCWSGPPSARPGRRGGGCRSH